MKATSQISQDTTVLKFYEVTRNLSFVELPALVELASPLSQPEHPNPAAAFLVDFLKCSPILEELGSFSGW